MAEPFKIIPTNARVTPLSSNTSGLQNVTPDVPFVRKSNSKLELKTNPHKKSMIQRKIKPLRGHTLLSKKKVKYDSNTTMAVFEEEMELVNVANATEMGKCKILIST